MTTAKPESPSTPDFVQLDIRKANGNVVVTPQDQDRFVLKMDRAIAACQLFVTAERFQKLFTVLLNRLGAWVSKQDGVESAWITMRDGQFLFLVMRKVVAYDRDFEDALTQLELDIASDSDLGQLPVSTMALPKVSMEAVCSFVDPGVAFHFSSTSRGSSR